MSPVKVWPNQPGGLTPGKVYGLYAVKSAEVSPPVLGRFGGSAEETLLRWCPRSWNPQLVSLFKEVSGRTPAFTCLTVG